MMFSIPEHVFDCSRQLGGSPEQPSEGTSSRTFSVTCAGVGRSNLGRASWLTRAFAPLGLRPAPFRRAIEKLAETDLVCERLMTEPGVGSLAAADCASEREYSIEAARRLLIGHHARRAAGEGRTSPLAEPVTSVSDAQARS
jgi:hypothetical protein